MNIWAAFFLVLSFVVLASPFLFPKSRSGETDPCSDAPAVETPPDPDIQELRIDLAAGKLTLDDFQAMTGKMSGIGDPEIRDK